MRGRLAPRILPHLTDTGWTVHRVGSAAYVHRDADHYLFGVYGPDERPAWADRLGRPSPGYLRRWSRAWAAQAWRRMIRDQRGRFLVRALWYRWPAPLVYRWQQP